MANDLSPLQKEIFVKKVMARLSGVNVMLANNLVNRDWEGELNGEGGVITVRSLSDITLRPYTRTTTISYEDLLPSKESFVVDAGQYFAFFVDDLDKYTSDIDALSAYAEVAQGTLNDAIEAKILSVYGQAAAANRVTGASNAAIAITPSNVYSYFVEAGKRLDDQKVPSVGRFAIVDSTTKAAIAQSPDLIRSTAMGDSMVQGVGVNAVNRIGNIAGFETFWSANAPSDNNAKYLLFGDSKAIAYAGVIRETEKYRMESKFATALRGLLVDGAFVSTEGAKRLATVKVAK